MYSGYFPDNIRAQLKGTVHLLHTSSIIGLVTHCIVVVCSLHYQPSLPPPLCYFSLQSQARSITSQKYHRETEVTFTKITSHMYTIYTCINCITYTHMRVIIHVLHMLYIQVLVCVL